MMKKIALVTCYFQPNYGSQLQAYATQMLFDKLGVENETICIDGLQKEINNAKYKYFFSNIFDTHIVKDKLGFVRHKLAVIFKGSDYKEKMALRNHKFREFSNSKFRISKKFNSKIELGNSACDYSGFVVGSDQLWLPSNIEGDYYTLNFVPMSVPKIAYATSFGVSDLPAKQKHKAEKFLSRFDYLSIREKSGKELIHSIIGIDVPVVSDPTLLFQKKDWEMLLPKNRFYSEKYLFCYFLGDNPSQRAFATKLAQKLGLKIVQLQHMDKYIKSDEEFPDYAPYNVGPAEFVQLIRDADFVLTDSFHCSVFSMIFSKLFFSFRRFASDSNVSTNSRLYSLLQLTQQERRLLNADEDLDEVLAMKIDYKQVHKNIDVLNKSSFKYINKVLEELNNHQ